MGLHSYYVQYIERSGRTAERLVMAANSSDARRRASDGGCEDVLSARRARFFTRTVKCLLAISTIAVVIAVVAHFA